MPPPPPPPRPPFPPAPASASATRFATHWVADALAGDESIQFAVLHVHELLRASSNALSGAPEATRERVVLRALPELSSVMCEGVVPRINRQVLSSGKIQTDLLRQEIQEAICKKLALPETSFQLLKGVDPWIASMTSQSQLEHNGTEQCGNNQSLYSSYEFVNIKKLLFPTSNAEVQQEAMTNLVKESETGILQKGPSAPTSVLHQPCTPESRSCVPPREDTLDAVALGTRSSEKSPIVEGNMSVGSVPAPGFDRISFVLPTDASEPEHLPECIAAQDTTMKSQPDSRKAHPSALQHERGEKVNQDLEDVCANLWTVEKDHVHGDLTLQSFCNGANQGSKSVTNLQPGTATEDRMASEEQNADKCHLEVSVANNANQALHDGGSIIKNNLVHCFPEQKMEKNRTDVQKDNCGTSNPSSSKDRDGETTKKASNEEKSEDTSSKDQDNDDTPEDEGLSEQDLCIKCSKDGQLLKCGDCLLVIHDSCFGSSVTFEETNLFNCPVCFYKKTTEADKKAKTTYKKAKKAHFEARKNFASFLGITQTVKQHDEHLTSGQTGAAKRDSHSNGSDMSKRNSTLQNEAYDLAHQDEEPLQQRKKHKINAKDNGCPKEVLTEKVPFQNSGLSSMNKNSALQNNSKTQLAGDKEACNEAGNDNSSHEKRASSPSGCDPPSNQYGEADQEDGLIASNQSGGSDELEAASSNDGGKRPSPLWRNMRDDKKGLHEKESVVSSKSRKGIAKHDQHMPTSRRKKCGVPVRPQKCYSNPVGSVRRTKLRWKEVAMLREAMAKFTPQDNSHIPWTRILAYGYPVFHKRRQPDDLRVKWRNLRRNAGY